MLLRGVNDSVPALEALMRALLTARVKPYYLHQLDLAPGTSHFRVPLAEGQALVRALRGSQEAIDFADSNVLRKAATLPMSGFSEPSRTTMPISDRASSTLLSACARPRLPSSSAAPPSSMPSPRTQ